MVNTAAKFILLRGFKRESDILILQKSKYNFACIGISDFNGRTEYIAGRQHLKLTQEDGQESLGIEGSTEAFFLETDSFAYVGIFTKSQ